MKGAGAMRIRGSSFRLDIRACSRIAITMVLMTPTRPTGRAAACRPSDRHVQAGAVLDDPA
jgi:hypothetical protein